MIYGGEHGCRAKDGHEPNEKLMRDVEERIDIPEPIADDFRRSLVAFFGDMLRRDKPIYWDSNPLLKRAIELKITEVDK